MRRATLAARGDAGALLARPARGPAHARRRRPRSEAAPGGRRQPAERAARHDRHAAGRSPGRLRLPPRDEPEHRRARAPRGRSSTQAYTYWPKTRGSFVALHDRAARVAERLRQDAPAADRLQPDARERAAGGRLRHGRPSSTTRTSPPRSATRRASRATARPGRRPALASEMDRTRAITADGVAYLGSGRARAPVLPVAALRQPARSLRAARALRHRPSSTPRRRAGRCSRRWPGFHGGVPTPVGPRGSDRSAGTWRSTTARSPPSTRRSAGCSRRSSASAVRDRTLVVVSLRPRREPGRARLLLRPRREPVRPVAARSRCSSPAPGSRPAGARPRSPRRSTSSRPLLDALKVSYPPDLAGLSLLGAARGEPVAGRARLPGQNDRNLLGAWGAALQDRGDAHGRRDALRALRSGTRTRARRGTPRARTRGDAARRAARAGAVP